MPNFTLDQEAITALKEVAKKCRQENALVVGVHIDVFETLIDHVERSLDTPNP